MTIPLPDARELSDEVLEALRLRALRGCQLGLTETQVAQILGVARETVCRWWSAYADHGVQALPQRRTGRPLGSGRMLTDSQADRIQHFLARKSAVGIGARDRSGGIGSVGISPLAPRVVRQALKH